jgi:CBS domain-containing protein
MRLRRKTKLDLPHIKDDAINLKAFINKVTIGQVMTKPSYTVEMEEELSVIESLFTQHGIRHMPIVDLSGKLVGLITQRSLYKIRSPRRLPETGVVFGDDKIVDGDSYYEKSTLDSYILKEVMLKNPPTLKAENSLADALKVMVEKKMGCVIIVNDEKKVEGIISRLDILKLFYTLAVK